MLRVNAINRQELLKCLTFNPKSLVFKTVSVPAVPLNNVPYKNKTTRRFKHCEEAWRVLVGAKVGTNFEFSKFLSTYFALH